MRLAEAHPVVVCLAAFARLEAELDRLVGLAGDVQRELTVFVTACLGLFAEHDKSHVCFWVAPTVAEDTREGLDRLGQVRGGDGVRNRLGLLALCHFWPRHRVRRSHCMQRQPQPGDQARAQTKHHRLGADPRLRVLEAKLF